MWHQLAEERLAWSAARDSRETLDQIARSCVVSRWTNCEVEELTAATRGCYLRAGHQQPDATAGARRPANILQRGGR